MATADHASAVARWRHPANRHLDRRRRGERIADRVTRIFGSWRAAYAAPLILPSQNRQADTDRITAEHDYRVNQLALQHFIAWHRDTHGPDCTSVQQVGSAAEGLLTELSRDL